TLGRGITNQVTVRDDLEHQTPGGRHRPSSHGSSTWSAPTFLLRDRIPRDKRKVLSFGWHRSNGRRSRTRLAKAGAEDSDISFSRLVNEIFFELERATAVGSRGNVNQTRRGIERHRRPVMGSIGRRRQRDGFLVL